MANELTAHFTTGQVLYVQLMNAVGQTWNSSTFEEPADANWATYDIALTEAGMTGIYRGTMPAVAAGVYTFPVYKQAGANPAVGDQYLGRGKIEWNGTVEVSLTSRATQTSVDDVPTVDEILLRDWTAVVGVVPDRSTLNALRFLRNKWAINGTTLTVTEEDDLTPAWTAEVTSESGAAPVIGINPA